MAVREKNNCGQGREDFLQWLDLDLFFGDRLSRPTWGSYFIAPPSTKFWLWTLMRCGRGINEEAVYEVAQGPGLNLELAQGFQSEESFPGPRLSPAAGAPQRDRRLTFLASALAPSFLSPALCPWCSRKWWESLFGPSRNSQSSMLLCGVRKNGAKSRE